MCLKDCVECFPYTLRLANSVTTAQYDTIYLYYYRVPQGLRGALPAVVQLGVWNECLFQCGSVRVLLTLISLSFWDWDWDRDQD